MTDAIVMPTHPQFKNLEGQTFGRLTVISYAGKSTSKRCLWRCRCKCGNETVLLSASLGEGRTQSCGCLTRQRTVERNTIHNLTGSAEHNVWMAMLRRCSDSKQRCFSSYGGRGITVCDRWKDSFQNFLEDMGERPSKHHSIEREDNDGHYCPENCVWALPDKQSRNTRRTRMLTHDGKTMCLSDWAKEAGISKVTLSDRLKAGWSVSKALQKKVTKARLLTCGGKRQSVPEWSKELSLSPFTIYSRLQSGCSDEDALRPSH